MKQRLLLSAALLAFILMPFISSAQRHDFFVNAPTGQPLYYKINSDSTTVTLVSFHDGGGNDSVTGNLIIPNTVTYNNTTYTVTIIGNFAFAYCNVSSVIIPNTVISIGSMVFWNSPSITSITLGNSVTSISYGVFMYTNITSLTIPASVTHISSQFVGGGYSLDTLVVASENSVYDSRNNCNAIIETATNKLIAGCRNTVIPNTVTVIGDSAFALTPSSFNIVIPNAVTSIETFAFGGCLLNSITSLAIVPPTLGVDVFSPRSASESLHNIPVYVPSEALAAYRADSGWSYFTNIRAIGSISVVAEAADSTMGSVSGAGTYDSGDTATLTAVASCGYRFDRWNDSVTDNPRQVVVTADTTFTAFFVSDADTVFIHDTTIVYDTLMLHDTLLVQDTLTIHDTLLVHDTLTVYDTLTIHDTVGVALAYYTLTVSADPLSGIAVGSGRFSDSTIVEIVAIPVEGNFFVEWSDGSTENPRHVVMTEDITLQAVFDMPPVPTGVAETEFPDAEVTVRGATITVRGAEGVRVRVYDVQGRLMGSTPQAAADQRFRMPATGVYLVQLGTGAARRVVVR